MFSNIHVKISLTYDFIDRPAVRDILLNKQQKDDADVQTEGEEDEEGEEDDEVVDLSEGGIVKV